MGWAQINGSLKYSTKMFMADLFAWATKISDSVLAVGKSAIFLGYLNSGRDFLSYTSCL